MGDLFAYSGLTTKLKAMEGRLIKEDEYLTLSNMTSVQDVVAFLKGHRGYSAEFESMEASSIHRATMEKILAFSKYRDFTSIYKFANVKQRVFLDLYFIRFETVLLKKAIRGLDYESDPEYFDKLGQVFIKYSKINIVDVFKCSTIEEIIEALKDTPYYGPLKRVEQAGDSKVFDYEMALDLFFFRYAWNNKEKFFKKKDLKSITMCIGTEIDTLNIIWIYRAKKYYKLSAGEIYAMIIPVYHRLKMDQMDNLIKSADMDEFMNNLNNTVYGSHFIKIEEDKMSLEKAYGHILDKMYNKFYHDDPYSLAAVNAYLYNKELEIKKLITIAECIRYKYTPDAILKEII